jgi:hypothetical protein
MIEAKAFKTFSTIYSIFKIERLSTNIKLTLHEALIRSVKTYACPAWESAADAHLMKLQRLQNKVFRATGNFPRRTPVRNSHAAFKLPYVYDYTYANSKKKSYKIMKMQMFSVLHKAKPYIQNTRGLNLAVVQLTTVQVTRLPL